MVETAQGDYYYTQINEEHNNVLVVGCIHGDEPQGNYLLEEYVMSHNKSRLMIIPCLNPDGVAAGTRGNANGVDLNRNFPTKNWELTNSEDKFFGGNKPASEKETKYLIKIVETYKPELILMLHAPYKIVNYDGPAKEIAQKIAAIIGYPVEASIGYPTPGSFGTWAGVERNIPVITLELDEEVDVKELRKPIFEILEMLESYKVHKSELTVNI